MLGTPFLGAGPYKITCNGNPLAATIETSVVILGLWQCYAWQVLDTPAAHPENGGAAPDAIHTVVASVLQHEISVNIKYTIKYKNCQFFYRTFKTLKFDSL